MIHKFKMFNNFIVLDVESGCVHLVDELTFKILDYVNFKDPVSTLKELILKFKDYEEKEISERFEELLFLYKKEMLFSEFSNFNFNETKNKAAIKALCLHIAHDCNLRCKYCFASTGDFKQGRMLMPFEVAKAAVDFLIKNSQKRRNLEIDFFGGEPLLNFEVLKKTIKYAREKEKKFNKNFRFTVTTNGVLLNSEKIKYINENMHNVVLSLDGRKEVNNKFRITENGQGSYDLVIEKFKEFAKVRGEKNYYIRGTFTKNNLDFVKDFIHFHENGFKNISIEPVVCEKEKEYAINEEDLPKIFDEYEKLAELIIKEKESDSDVNFFHFNIDLTQGPCILKRIRGCGCGCEYVAVSPEGDIFPCHQFVGEKKWLMGNLLSKTFNEKLKEKFEEVNLLNKKDCLKCWAKYYCGGGCNANNFKYAGDVLKPYLISCEMEKKRVECAIAIKAVLEKSKTKIKV